MFDRKSAGVKIKRLHDHRIFLGLVTNQQRANYHGYPLVSNVHHNDCRTTEQYRNNTVSLYGMKLNIGLQNLDIYP